MRQPCGDRGAHPRPRCGLHETQSGGGEQRKKGPWLGRAWEATIRAVAISQKKMGNCWLEAGTAGHEAGALEDRQQSHKVKVQRLS